MIASYHLGPLDAQETQAYIEHRLSHVGWVNDPSFELDAFSAIYGYSGGIPRRINTLCDRLMLGAYLGERHVISESDVREVIEELKEEFASARARPVQTPHFAGAAADAGIALQLDALALDRLRASPELAEHAAGLAGNYDLQRIEARLAGLEHSVSATLSVLSQLLQAVRRDTPATDKTE